MSESLAMAAEAADPPRTATAAGAGERLAALFDAHWRPLYRLARRMTSDPEEARDLVQEVFLRALRHAPALPAEEPRAFAWLVRVLVNLCRDRHRRLAVRRRVEAALPAPRETALDHGPESLALARDAVQAALAALSPRRRAVVVLHELEGRSVAAVAALLGVTLVTVRCHLAAARRQLAARLLPGGPK